MKTVLSSRLNKSQLLIDWNGSSEANQLTFSGTWRQHFPLLPMPERFFRASMSQRSKLNFDSPLRTRSNLWRWRTLQWKKFAWTTRKTASTTELNNFSLPHSPREYYRNGEVWKTVEFEPTPVMSTYLVAFAAAEFRNLTTHELELEFSVYSSQNSINNMKYALDVGREALRALETYVGHNYTLSKMNFIAIDDFLMGAMVSFHFH